MHITSAFRYVQDEAERLEAALEKRHEEELTQRSVAEFGLADATDTVEDADAEPEPKVAPALSCVHAGVFPGVLQINQFSGMHAGSMRWVGHHAVMQSCRHAVGTICQD